MPVGLSGGAPPQQPHSVPDLRLVMLGTGARWPTPERGVSGAVVIFGGEHILVDCGEGTQRQMMRSIAGLRRLSAILITHCHGDHVLGLPGLLATLSDVRTAPLTILGPSGLGDLIDGFRVHFGALAFPLTVREVPPGHVERRDGHRLRAVASRHSIPSLAWVVEEDALPGHLIEAHLRRIGLPAGPERAALARGEAVTLSDGRRIDPSQVAEPPRRGRKVVFSGDTRPEPAVREASEAADVLVHEATFLERDRELAVRSGHSTAADAACLAADAGVRLLVLVHRSSRYSREEVLSEARAYFPAAVAPMDLDLIDVPHADRGDPRLWPGGGRA